ncbi:MAG TPA: pyridoxal phosphate-dependent aminotransferase [Holophaga sp.]|nr:pyridoxal phosphate-dependent aminotransferase [Holophaga sp.]
MPVSTTVAQQLQNASWIRRMFEDGIKLKAERGAENVYDFSLGNPDPEPPQPVMDALRKVVAENHPRSHAYMANAGFPEVRAAMAARLSRATGLDYTAGHILMTVGAAGALNTLLKAILDPGDEVVILAPYFAEYLFYISNHGGKAVVAETRQDFTLDLDAVAAALSPRTKAILINTPNNPTGAVYSIADLKALEILLSERAPQALVISDEPYKAILYDGNRQPEVSSHITRSVVVNSWSKQWAVPGERIGYLAISPRVAEADELAGACAFTQRVLGFVNAPAIWQWVAREVEDASVELAPYQEKLDLLCEAFSRIGYRFTRPGGSFYVFPQTPIPDDVAFVQMLQEEGILAVPGRGFGRAGHIRLSLTLPLDELKRSLPGFERAFAKATR